MIREPLRDDRRLPWLEDAVRDVAYGVRTLGRRPGFALTAILSLALGIGANSGIFSLVDQALLRLLPVPEPERLVQLDWRGNAFAVRFGVGNVMSYPLCRDLQQHDRLFDGVLCRVTWGVNFSTGQQYEVVHAEMVSGSYFSTLRIRPELGRLIDASDDVRPGEHPVVVLSHDYWQNRLAGAEDVVGRRVLVNGHPMTVIGVAAAGFRGMDLGEPATLWLPAMMVREATLEWGRVLDRRAIWVQVFARLKRGVTVEAAEAGLQPWFASMLETDTRLEGFPQVTEEQRRQFLASTIDVLPGGQGWSGLRSNLTRPLWLLMAGTTLLLLLACLNVAGLLLARGAERSEELATRMALGASRGRMTRQLIVEGWLIAVAGGLLGVAAAPSVSRLLLRFLPEDANLTSAIDHRIVLFALAVSLVVGALCAVAPALQAARRPLAASINGRSTADGVTIRFRKAIVGAQLALTLVLLAGAGLFVETLLRLEARDRGFDGSRLLMFRADPAGTGYPAEDAPRIMREVLRALQGAPGVERAALANIALLGAAGPTRDLVIESDPRRLAEFVPTLRISEGFFSAVGVPLVAGREFDELDTRDVERDGIRAVIVNESFARRYFGSRNPVGRRVGFGNRPETPTDVEIVGVVRDFSRRVLRDDRQPEHLFVPFAQTGSVAGDGTFYVKVRGAPESAVASIRAAVAGVDARLPLTSLTTLDEQVTRHLTSERMLATLTSGFGTVALILSVVGLFGVMSFVVTQRTQEIGLRMALGATRTAAIRLVVGDALITIAAGAAVGMAVASAAAVLAGPSLARVLYGVTPSDLGTLAMTTTLLTGVALAACGVPAARAAVMSPMVAMRGQQESMWRTAGRTVRRAIGELTDAEPAAVPPVTLISEFTGLVQRAESFSEALHVALPALRERVGAHFIMLLEKVGDDYRGKDCSIPARGVLINRLRHFPHPLPLTAGDFQAWLRWAREFRPEHVSEIERLGNTGARIAVALRTRREIVGVLLLGPPEGRESFTDSERQVLSSSAELFALMIENARLNDRALEQEKVRRDLALAAEVQRRLLPPQPPSAAAATLAAFTLPARTVGGDYYDFFDLPDGRIGIAVADIAGKGIAAALLMSVVQASLRVISGEPDIGVSQLAAKMNRFLHRSTASNGYATFFYALLDADGRRLRYVNAGHNPPYLVRRTEAGVDVTDLTVGGTVLGLFPDVEYEDAAVDLRPGDLFVAFTDGVTEARSASGEEFGEERLKDLLRGTVGDSAADVASMLADQMRQWIAGAEQHDDLTFVVATVNPVPDVVGASLLRTIATPQRSAT